jgi:tRNA A58 N-methylase Trm61
MKKDLHTSLDKYELGERILIEKYVKEGDIIIEAGTSIGLITGLLSNIIGPKDYVFTIEGDNKLITIAQNINRLNNNIHFLMVF